MRTIHLLRVEGGPEPFAALIAAAAADGIRAGWLDLETVPEPPDTVARAADTGVLRAVARTTSGTLAAKSVAGGPILRELLREQFLGCRWVLVRGEVDAPLQTPTAGGWRIRSDEGILELSTEALVSRLRRPRTTFLRD